MFIPFSVRKREEERGWRMSTEHKNKSDGKGMQNKL
jgi:hypothetical protein